MSGIKIYRVTQLTDEELNLLLTPGIRQNGGLARPLESGLFVILQSKNN